MKKTFFALLAIALVSSVCFAEEVSAPSTAAVPAGTEIITGRIDSVSGGGNKPQMTIRGEDGAETVFLIATDATIFSKDGSVTTLTWINRNKVSVKYVTSQNGAVRTATSIKVLSDF